MESGDMNQQTSRRKDEHIRASIENNVMCNVSAGFEDVSLVHSSLPEVNLKDIQTSISLFKKHLDYPCIISAITGGSEKTGKINKRLALLASKFNIGISVGSQRAMLERPYLRETYDIRAHAPDVLLFSNLGLAQVIEMGNEEVSDLVDSIGADVLEIHLNPLQEAIQPEGDTDFKGGLDRLKDLKSALDIPVVAKETGAGISYEVAKTLGFLDGIEVSGVGGTSFAAVEYYRAKTESQKNLARMFWDWGIPTVPSIIESSAIHENVIASGGIRNGLHIAKSLALGASCAGLAMPFLSAVYKKTYEDSEKFVESLVQELKTAMFLVGASNIEEMSNVHYVLGGKTREYLEQRKKHYL